MDTFESLNPRSVFGKLVLVGWRGVCVCVCVAACSDRYALRTPARGPCGPLGLTPGWVRTVRTVMQDDVLMCVVSLQDAARRTLPVVRTGRALGAVRRAVGCRRLLQPVHAQAATPRAHPEAQRHVPHVRLPARLRGLVLPQRRHLLHRQDRRVPHVLVRVLGRLHGQPVRVQGP